MGELNDILERLRATLGPSDGPPVELEGGITNRNFRVTLGGAEYVVRRPGKDTDLLGIDRDTERIATEAAAGLGLAPAVAASLEDCLVTSFVPCAQLDARELAACAEEIGRVLRRVHDSGVRLPSEFRVGSLLEAYAGVLRTRARELSAGYRRAASLAAEIEAALAPVPPRPCHNDLLAGNIIRALDGRMMFVDWEYAGMGDPRFDLGNLSVNNEFDEAADERLLGAYYGSPPCDRERAALKLMRVLSDAREGAWGVVQEGVSELDFDFAGYAREHFERIEETVEREPFSEWLRLAGGRDGAAA